MKPGLSARTAVAVAAIIGWTAGTGQGSAADSLQASGNEFEFVASTQVPAPAQDVVAAARKLALGGKRAAAITMLTDRLAIQSDDNDARTLLGIILSWEGRYDEARSALRIVLRSNPTHADALPALVSVELWSDHPGEAAALAADALRERPENAALLLSYARACQAMNREAAALDALDRLLAFDPRNDQARRLRTTILDSQWHWAVGYGYAYDWFSDHRSTWSEQQVALKRAAGWGSVILRASQADRLGLRDQQLELDLYPRLRQGTYLYLNAGWTPNRRLYPDYRYGLHLYQGFGRGFEGSFGYSRLGFGSGVNIYIASLSKYVGNWLLIGQTFITPRVEGTNVSYHAAFRRYVVDKSYVGLRYQHGWANERMNNVDDIGVLNADGVTGEVVAVIRRRWELTLRGGYSRQQRVLRGAITQYSASGTLYLRF